MQTGGTEVAYLKSIQECEIISIEQIAPQIFDMWVKNDVLAAQARPGQFVHIDCGDATDNFLRRPISICDVKSNAVRILFEVKGSGTAALACKKAGDVLDMLGPLGNAFTVLEQYRRPLIIGGGIGIFPLYLLAKQFSEAQVFLGFRCCERVVMEQDFKNVAKELHITTDDGSYGYHGYAVELLERKLAAKEGDIIYACGPLPMLRATKALAEKYNVKCQLSMEQRMGCGIGACLVCTCETTSKGANHYKRVCKNGPVFWSDEVTLNG